MKKRLFIERYYSLAEKAGEFFGLNPVVMLAQCAIESGWGTSKLAMEHHNFFGICAYGKPNEFWPGESVRLGHHGLEFRRYTNAEESFMDYARLIKTAYPMAASVSYHLEAFAQEIAYSKYISETNGDNRENYRSMLISISRAIFEIKKEESWSIKNEK